MVGSDSDSDIEIIESKASKKTANNRDDIIQDLEIIENQSQPSTSEINISLSQDVSKKSMKIKIDSPGSSKVKFVLGKRKADDTEKTGVKTKVSKSTSEVHFECSFESKADTSLSTSEIVLQGLMDKSSSSEESEDEGLIEPKPKSVSVSDCVESFLKICERLLPVNDYKSVDKKITKYLNKLDPKHQQSNPLKEFLHKAWSLVDSDTDNIFIHVKEVVEELKKHKVDNLVSSSGATTSDNSDHELKEAITDPKIKKRVSLTTLTSAPTPRTNHNTHSDLMILDRIISKPKEDIWSSMADECKGEPSPRLETKLQDQVGASQAIDVDREELHKSDNHTNKYVKGKGASNKHILKLEKALEACARNITKCEEAEIDWDQEDSTFVMADKWKKKFMAIYNKLAKYKGEAPDLERCADKRFTFTEGKYPEVNKKIEKYITKTKTIPDFWDVKALIEKVNLENKLSLTEMQIHNESEKIFILVGRKLKKRRNVDDGNAFYSYLAPDDTGDPAADNPELEKRLNELGKEAEKKINKVFEDFARKQASERTGGEDDSETEVEESDEDDDDGDVGSVDLNETEPAERENSILVDDADDDSSNSSKVSCGSLDSLLEDEEEILDKNP